MYEDAFTIEAGAPDERLELAARLLASGGGVVLFDGLVALRPAGRQLRCEVLDPAPSSRRCSNEYEVLVENARCALEASRLAAHLPDVPRSWLVVGDEGTGTKVLWPVS